MPAALPKSFLDIYAESMYYLGMETRPGKWQVSELAKKIGVSRDTLDKARRKGTTSTRTARKLELLTGVSRLKFLYPSEYGDPWADIVDVRGDGRPGKDTAAPKERA